MKIECGVRVLAVILIAASITSCVAPDMRHQIVISARDQKLALLDRGNVMAIYPVSTSKFGLGDWQMEIEPYLEEFFFDQPQKFEQFRWEAVHRLVMP